MLSTAAALGKGSGGAYGSHATPHSSKRVGSSYPPLLTPL